MWLAIVVYILANGTVDAPLVQWDYKTEAECIAHLPVPAHRILNDGSGSEHEFCVPATFAHDIKAGQEPR